MRPASRWRAASQKAGALTNQGGKKKSALSRVYRVEADTRAFGSAPADRSASASIGSRRRIAACSGA